ncbi:MAG: trypsin-like peptidase domain-containing protein [Chitinispirillaceae bacterium]|nr:trypsin-like peptidase domain-containing protein [Chitinispirillaceae bacterium]
MSLKIKNNLIYFIFLAAGMIGGLLIGPNTIKKILPQRALEYLQPYSSYDTTQLKLPEDKSTKVPESHSKLTNTISSDNALSISRRNAIVVATEAVAPAVVGIVVTQIQVVRSSYYSNDFFDFFFGPDIEPRYRQVESMGSGFVIREDGKILTNYHVVQNATKLYVNFQDGKKLEGKIIGIDEQSDLAVVSVNAKNLPCVKIGDVNKTMIGEWAIAIGNPFLNFINDVHPTVTVGVVSALNRNFTPTEGVYYQNMIQTDAAINPGNSGGPLVNADGEVIGINTFIFTGSSNTRGSIGIGFAIPINRAIRVAEEIIKFGRRRPIWTGISVQDLNPALALALGYNSTDGVVIVNIVPGSPGQKAGLMRGDIIRKMGNRTIFSHLEIDGFFLDYFVGDSVEISFIRNGKKLKTKLILEEYKE